MPACSAAVIKSYLLCAASRCALAAQIGASFCTTDGIAGLRLLLANRSFLCLHYCLRDGRLLPCTAAPAATPPHAQAAPGPSSADKPVLQPAAALASSSHLGIQDSNVQVGILLRRGIGGTAKARAVRLRSRNAVSGLVNYLSTLSNLAGKSTGTVHAGGQVNAEGGAAGWAAWPCAGRGRPYRCA